MYKHKVQYYETDKMGITHHSNYIRWMEEARVSYLSDIGWDYKRLEDEGIISPVLEVNCQYKNSTTFSDDITIETSVLEFNGIKLKLGYKMYMGEKIAAEATSLHCFLDKDGRPIRLKKDFPEFFDVLNGLLIWQD
ncbi:MAG: acyl-CoA thioesterase [Lachnospiraceae bacterium]|nr:acyl-CoA thioesterase [Lachnospiraceae bacterium]